MVFHEEGAERKNQNPEISSEIRRKRRTVERW
jgi:hypothetical protein